MESKPVFISIASQKGGIGKSTYTILLASLLHYRYGYNVLVADCDYPQWSIQQQRTRELAVMENSDYYKLLMLRQYRQTEHKVWPIICTRVQTAEKDVSEYIASASSAPDVVLFDLPGTIGTKGVLALLSHLDYVFVPMKADKAVMESSITFARTLREGYIQGGTARLQGVYMFWTMIDRRERTALYEQYEKALESFSLPLMQCHIPMRSRFSREISPGGGPVFRSTLYAPEQNFVSDACIDALAAEICTITQIG